MLVWVGCRSKERNFVEGRKSVLGAELRIILEKLQLFNNIFSIHCRQVCHRLAAIHSFVTVHATVSFPKSTWRVIWNQFLSQVSSFWVVLRSYSCVTPQRTPRPQIVLPDALLAALNQTRGRRREATAAAQDHRVCQLYTRYDRRALQFLKSELEQPIPAIATKKQS